ncbi:UNVERIFIED_CONTAM: Exportin-2 [Sesamum latifolium]|uniref:Exportin-2 n=1 Tax=Sesamum latifolium TaxID=2727402 RepID=A0AAW2U7D4_9LAMI
MSQFLVKHGPEKLATTMNSVQPDVFPTILEQFWIPNLKLITRSTELKLTSVASTRPEDRVEEDPEVADFGETIGYSGTFLHLYNAGRKEEEPVRDISDPRQYLVASLFVDCFDAFNILFFICELNRYEDSLRSYWRAQVVDLDFFGRSRDRSFVGIIKHGMTKIPT